MQDDTLTHETEDRTLLPVPMLGLLSRFQDTPSQTITSVSDGDPFSEYEPTAVHDDGLTHETASRLPPPLPKSGLPTCPQNSPSQANTNGELTEALNSVPTARHDDALTHDTDLNSLKLGLGLGLDAIVALSTTAPAGVETT
ncbi:MAG: hypothetical protein F2585_09000, partial [Actinobacteria bacterium]|nr:hypothetical protein [Actinomycetota bacterium]